MERNQFTFYRSFFAALQKIRKKSARADAYDAICRYALNGEAPNLEAMESGGAIAFALIMPVLTSGRKKAEMRARQKEGGASQWEDSGLTVSSHWQDTGSNKGEKEAEGEKEVEIEVEKEREKEVEGEGGKEEAFERFWNNFPKKVGKTAAKAAFSKVDVPLDVLLDAIAKQKQSAQWQKGGGQYIPNPATWLSQCRWEDELPYAGGYPKGASGRLGKAEIENIQRMLKEGG